MFDESKWLKHSFETFETLVVFHVFPLCVARVFGVDDTCDALT
jgi:hypothetical protein